MKPSYEQLSKLFSYDHETGVLTRLTAAGGYSIGTIAGCPDKFGYLRVQVEGKKYPVHQIGWVLFYKKWPMSELDHKNCLRSDNRIKNLRPATRSTNLANSRRPVTNTSGFKGVSCAPWGVGLWRAKIKVRKKQIFLGDFHSREAAHAAYRQAAKKHFGDFARDK